MKAKKIQRRKNVLWFLTKEELQNLVDSSDCLKEIILKTGNKPFERNFDILRFRVDELEIDTSSLKDRSKKLRQSVSQKGADSNKIPLEKILVIDSKYNNSQLKDRLLREGLLLNICAECGIAEWRGKTLVIQLDHVNGDSSDNRLDNLRMLCPNCHSQTETFCKKKGDKRVKPKSHDKCPVCGNSKMKYSKTCNSCKFKIEENRARTRRIQERPSLSVLESGIREFGYAEMGRRYGVCGATIKNWMADARSPIQYFPI